MLELARMALMLIFANIIGLLHHWSHGRDMWRGLKLEAPYGSSARGRLVAHACARFHGCPSKTLDDATVLVERPRSPSHALRHGATISDAYATSRGRRLGR